MGLEKRLRAVRGISEGDARQVVSCAYPFDGVDTQVQPILDWFVAEDRALIGALNGAQATGAFPELGHLQFGTVRDLVSTDPFQFELS